MIKWGIQSVSVLIIAGLVLSILPERLAAQEETLTWLVVTFKLQIVPGKPMMQLTGPLPTSSMCEAMLKFAQEAVSRQGIEIASSVCRKDVTVVIPEQGVPKPAPSAPGEGH